MHDEWDNLRYCMELGSSKQQQLDRFWCPIAFLLFLSVTLKCCGLGASLPPQMRLYPAWPWAGSAHTWWKYLSRCDREGVDVLVVQLILRGKRKQPVGQKPTVHGLSLRTS